METVDPRLLEEYQKMAATGTQFLGFSVFSHRVEIGKLIKETHSQTILDYGSGAGICYEEKKLLRGWGSPKVTLYDPAFPAHANKPPGAYDGVICCDVLEHIPEAYVDAVIDELFGYAIKFVWASVCCRPAKKCFPSGENLHCTVKPFEWWERRMAELSTCPFFLVETK